MLSIALLTLTIKAAAANTIGIDLIYGRDDRYEVNEYPNTLMQEKARSVAVRVLNSKLEARDPDSNIIDFLKIPLKSSLPDLCPDERFHDQYAIGDCSGFLISKNRILTAGHCAMSDFDCSNSSWVFDYTNTSESFLKKDVYKCKKIIAQAYNYSKKKVADYAIIELERDTDREPLARRKFGTALLGTPLVVIGSPLGLPLKIADGANIKALNDTEKDNIIDSLILRRDYFLANLDSYSGNSGSPVFNKNSGKVEGILIQGADDFVYNETKGCMTSNNLTNSHKNSFEKVLRITRIPELKNSFEKSIDD